MEGIVVSYLDILRKGKTGLLWVGTASSLEDANSQIRARTNDAAEFVIFNSRTGDRISVWPRSTGAATQADNAASAPIETEGRASDGP